MAAKAPAAQAKAKVGRSTKSGSKSETPGGAAPKKAASPKRASVAAPAAGDAQGAPPPDDPAAAAAAAAGQLAPPPPKRGSIAKAASEGSGDSGKAKSAGSAKSKDSPKAKAAAGKAPSKSAQPAKAAPKAAKASAKAPAAKAKAGAKAASPKADSPAEPPVPAGEPAAEDVQSVLERLEGDWQPQDQREKREKIREGALIIAEDGTSAAITAEGSDKISVERDGAVKTATLSSDGELLWEDGSVWVRPAKEMLDTGASLMTEGNGSEALGEQPPAEQPAEEPGPAEDSPPPAEDRPPPADDGSAPAAPEAAAAPSPETADGEEAPEAVEDAKPADTTPTPADIQGLWTPRSRPDLVVLMQDGILILPDGVQTSYEVLPDGLFKFTKIDGTTEEARIKEGGELHFGDRVPDEVDGNLLMELRDAVSSGEIGGDVGGIEDNVISTDNIIFREGQVWERSRSLKWSLKVENLDFESLLSDPSLVKMASQIIEDAVAEITLLKPWQIRLELVYQEQAEEQPGQPGGTSVTVLANMGVASQGDNNDEEVMKRLHEGCEDMDSRIMDEIMLVPELHIIMTELQLRVTSSVSKQPAEEVSVKDVKKRARTLTLGGTELIKYMVSPSSSEDLAPLGRAATAPAERRATSMMRGKAKAYIQSVMKSSTFATRLASTGAAAEGEDDMEVTRLRSADFDKDLGQRWSVAAEEYKEAAFSLSSQILDLQDVLTSEAAEAKKLRKELKKEDQRRQVLTKDVAELHERLAESRDIVVKAEHKTSELIAEMMDEWDQRDEAAMLAAKGSKVGPRMHPDDLDVFQRTTAMLWNWTRMAGGILAAATAAAGRNLEVLVAASGQDRANLQLTMGAAAHESMMMAAVLRWCYLAAFMVRRAEEMEGPWWSITIHRNCVGKLVDLFRAGLLTMPGHSHSLGGGHGLSYGLSGGDEEEGVSRKTHNDTLCAWVRLVLILELYETHPILAKKRKPQISDNVSAIMATMPWKWVRLVDRLLRYSGLEDYNSDVAGLVRKLTTFASRSRVATGATAVTAATFETAHSEFVGGVGSLQNTPPEEFVGGVGSLEYTLSDVSRVGSEPTTPQVPSRDADLVWVQFACMLVARWKFGVLRASRDWIRLVVSAAWRAHAAASPAVLRSAVVETRDATRIEPVAKKWIRLVAKRLLGKNTGLFADRLKLVIGHDRELRRLRAQILESRAEATEAFREHGRLAGERVGIFESEVEACRAREAALEEEIQEHRGVAVDQAWSATTAEERLRSLHTDLLTAREAALLSVASARADLVEALDRAATSSHAAESLAGEAAGLRAGAKEQQQRIETILVMQEAAFSELNTHWEQRNAASVAAAKLESPEVKATAQRLSEIEPGPDVEKVLAEVEAMRQAAVVQAKHSDEVISAHRVLFNEMHEQWVRDSQDVDATQDLLRTEYAEARTQEECVRADLIVALSKLAKHEQATHQSQHIMQMQREALFEMQEHMASCGDASAAPQASEEDSQGAPPPSASAAIAASPAAAAAAAALAELGDVGGAIAASPTAAAAAAALAELADVGAGDAAGGLEKQADGVREAYDGGTASAGPPMLPGLGHRAAARAAAAVAAAEPGLEAELREQEEDPSLASGMRRINLGFGELSEAMRQINQGVIQVDDALMPIRSTSSEEAMEARDAVKKAVEQNLSVQDHIGDLRESLETMKMWSQDIDRFHAQMEGQERQLAEESRLAGHLEKVSDDLRLENLALRSAAGGDLLPIQEVAKLRAEIGEKERSLEEESRQSARLAEVCARLEERNRELREAVAGDEAMLQLFAHDMQSEMRHIDQTSERILAELQDHGDGEEAEGEAAAGVERTFSSHFPSWQAYPPVSASGRAAARPRGSADIIRFLREELQAERAATQRGEAAAAAAVAEALRHGQHVEDQVLDLRARLLLMSDGPPPAAADDHSLVPAAQAGQAAAADGDDLHLAELASPAPAPAADGRGGDGKASSGLLASPSQATATPLTSPRASPPVSPLISLGGASPGGASSLVTQQAGLAPSDASSTPQPSPQTLPPSSQVSPQASPLVSPFEGSSATPQEREQQQQQQRHRLQQPAGPPSRSHSAPPGAMRRRLGEALTFAVSDWAIEVSDDLRLENLALRSAAGGDLLPIQATPRDELEIGHSAMGAMQDWAADALLPAAAPSPDSPLAATGGGGGSGGGVGSDGGRLDVVAELDQQPTDAQSADMRRLVEAAVQEVSSQREAVLELREQLVNAAENAQLSDNRIQDLQAELREAGLQNSRLESQMQQRSPDPSPPRPRADAPGAPRSPAAGAGAGGGGGGEGGGEPLSPRTATALEEQAVTSERLRAAREELAHMKEEMREMKEASAAQEQQFREDMVSSVLEMKDQLQYIPQSVAREVVSQEADRWRRTHLAGDGSTSAAAAPPEAARTESERLRQQLHQLRSDDPVLAAPASVRSSFTSFMLGGSGLPRLPEDDGLPTTSSPPTPRRPESIGTGGPSVSETELLVHAQDFRGFNFSAHRVSLVSPLGEPEPERGTPRPTPRSGLEPEPEGHSPGTQGGGSSGSGQGPPQPRAASSGADLAAQVVPAPVPVSVWQWARLFALTVRSADAEARRAASQAAGRSVELARRWARLLVVILQTWQPTRESGFRQAALLLAGKVASVRGVAAEAQHRARLHAKHALTVQQLMIKDSQKRLASCTRIGRREKLQETLEQRGAGLLEMSRKLLLVSDDDWSEATSPWSPRSVGGGSSKDRSRLGSPR